MTSTNGNDLADVDVSSGTDDIDFDVGPILRRV